jgi:2-oxoglutarate ferredoxin oxidoreductase subunit delta
VVAVSFEGETDQMPNETKTRRAKGVRIVLTQKWCKGCGICVEMCPTKVFVAEEGTGKAIVAYAERCADCGLCELYCPDYAISLEREAGQ